MTKEKIKVLPLESWMKNLEEEDSVGNSYLMDKYKKRSQSAQTFSFPSIYLTKHECFFELGNGCSYAYDRESFIYSLNLCHATEYNHRQKEALKNIIDQKLASKKQKEIYYFIEAALEFLPHLLKFVPFKF